MHHRTHAARLASTTTPLGVIAAVTLGLGLAACGGDSTATDATATATDTAVSTDAAVVDDATASPDATAPGTDDASHSSLTIGEFCTQLPDAACDWLVACLGVQRAACPGFGFMSQLPAICNGAVDEVAAGRLSFDADAGEACLLAHTASDCKVGPPPPFMRGMIFGDPTNPCHGVLTGAVEAGQACYYDATRATDECAAGFCAHDASACPGQCAPFQGLGQSCDARVKCDPTTLFCSGALCAARFTEGADCSSAPDGCVAGLACFGGHCLAPAHAEGDACAVDDQCGIIAGACLGGTCKKKVAAGEHCSGDHNCPDGLGCRVDPASGDRTCQTPLEVGAPCDTSDPGSCGSLELVCMPPESPDAGTDGRCVAFGAVGEPCTEIGCGADLWCKKASLEDVGVCTARGGDGDSCEDGVSYHVEGCASGLACDYDGKCHAPSALGGPCHPFTVASCQAGLQCDRATYTCAAPSAENGQCNPRYVQGACEAGLFCECLDAPGCNGVSDSPNAREVCVAKLGDGGPCSSGFACASGRCDFSQSPSVCGPALPPATGCAGP